MQTYTDVAFNSDIREPLLLKLRKPLHSQPRQRSTDAYTRHETTRTSCHVVHALQQGYQQGHALLIQSGKQGPVGAGTDLTRGHRHLTGNKVNALRSTIEMQMAVCLARDAIDEGVKSSAFHLKGSQRNVANNDTPALPTR